MDSYSFHDGGIDRGWAAGFFDGEGTFVYDRRVQAVRLSVAQRDRELLDRFREIVGGLGSVTWQRSQGKTGLFVWVLCGARPVQAVCDFLEPLLSSRRQDQMAEMWSLWQARELKGHANKRKTHCPVGHPYDEANTRVRKDGARHCRICDRAHNRIAMAKWRARRKAGRLDASTGSAERATERPGLTDGARRLAAELPGLHPACV